MPSFLNALRKMPQLLDPERLMKTPPFVSQSDDIHRPVMGHNPSGQSMFTPDPVSQARARSSNAPVETATSNMGTSLNPMRQPPRPSEFGLGYGQGKRALIDTGNIQRGDINALEKDYIAERGQKRGWKDTLLNALSGAAQGIATTGDLGGALGGAIAGGAGTLINPKAGARFGFNIRERPQLEGMYAQQQQERALGIKEALQQAQIQNQQAQMQQRQAQAERAGRPEAPKLFQRNTEYDLYEQGPDGQRLVAPGKSKPQPPKWVLTPGPNGKPVYKLVAEGVEGYEKTDPLLQPKIKQLEAQTEKLRHDAKRPYATEKRLNQANREAVMAELDNILKELRSEGKSEAEIEDALRKMGLVQ